MINSNIPIKWTISSLLRDCRFDCIQICNLVKFVFQIDIRCLQFGEDEDVKTIDPPDPVDDE